MKSVKCALHCSASIAAAVQGQGKKDRPQIYFADDNIFLYRQRCHCEQEINLQQ
jgi:hypothetical protein